MYRLFNNNISGLANKQLDIKAAGTARVIDSCQALAGPLGTWKAGGVPAGTVALATCPEGEVGNCVQVTAATNFDTGIAYQLTTPIIIPDGLVQFFIHVNPFEVAGTNSYQQVRFRVRMYNGNPTGSPGNYYESTITLNPGWNLVTLGGEASANITGAGTTGYVDNGWTKVGTASFNDLFTTFDFYFTGNTSYTPAISFRQVSLGSPGKGVLSFTFDDAFTSVYNLAFPIMRSLGLTGTVGVIKNTVGVSGTMTVAQLNELYAAGWDIVNHTTSHGFGGSNPGGDGSAFLTLTAHEARVQPEYEECQEYCRTNGWTRDNALSVAISPFGNVLVEQCYAAHVAAASALGIRYLRGTTTQIQGAGYLRQIGSSCLNLDGSVGVNNYAGNMCRRISKAAEVGGYVDVLGHVITTTARGSISSNIDYNVTEFEAICKHVAALRDAGKLVVANLPAIVNAWVGGSPVR